jgi:hypothetical protein
MLHGFVAMKWLKPLAAGVFAAVLLAGFYNFALNQVDPTLYFDPKASAQAVGRLPVGETLLSVLALLIGILFGSLYDALRSRTTITSFRRELAQVLYSARFVRALLAAPIVFVAVYVAAKSQPDPVISLIFAFQNGFFCDAIMKPKERAARAGRIPG